MIDWAAKWFEIRAEMGQSDMATMMYKDPDKDWVQTHFRHREADGFGKIQSILQTEGISIQAPIRPLKKPNFLWQPFLLIKGILIHPQLKYNPWKWFSLSALANDPSEVSYWLLSHDENELLKQKAQQSQVNLGFYIMSEIDRRVKNLLYKNEKDESNWLCPVDVRGAYPDIPKTQNCVSFVIATFKDESVQQAFDQYRMRLKKKTYWAFWELYQIGKWIGISGMRKLAQRTQGKSFWMGSFSDLGIWNQDTLKNSHVCNRRWVIAPPGSSSYPVGLTTIEWCGLRTVTLKIHPSICGERKAKTLSDKIIADFKNSIAPAETHRDLSIS